MEGRTLRTMILVPLALLALAAAQLDLDQYTAVRALLAGLGCTSPKCLDFAADDLCPSVLLCANGRVVRIVISSGIERGLNGTIDGPALGALTGLTFLQLVGHTFTTIPTQIGRLTALTVLNLFSSALIGSVPSQVGRLINLHTLAIHTNRLTGTLPALDKLSNLAELQIGNNNFGGSMPAMPTSLSLLLAWNCSFTGLPPNLSALTLLRQLYVQQNKLFGPLPVIPASVTTCFLQTIADTNCFDCQSNSTVSPCSCVSNSNATACASLATTTAVATSTAATTATLAVSASLTTAPTSPTTTSAANPTSPAVLSATATTLPSGEPEPWVVGVIVGGAALAVILVGVAVFFLLKRRRAQKPAINNKAAELKQPQSNYAAINVSPPKEYDQGRLDSTDDQPAPSNYAVIPAKDYDNGRMNVDSAAGASEYNVGRLS